MLYTAMWLSYWTWWLPAPDVLAYWGPFYANDILPPIAGC